MVPSLARAPGKRRTSAQSEAQRSSNPRTTASSRFTKAQESKQRCVSLGSSTSALQWSQVGFFKASISRWVMLLKARQSLKASSSSNCARLAESLRSGRSSNFLRTLGEIWKPHKSARSSTLRKADNSLRTWDLSLLIAKKCRTNGAMLVIWAFRQVWVGGVCWGDFLIIATR